MVDHRARLALYRCGGVKGNIGTAEWLKHWDAIIEEVRNELLLLPRLTVTGKKRKRATVGVARRLVTKEQLLAGAYDSDLHGLAVSHEITQASQRPEQYVQVELQNVQPGSHGQGGADEPRVERTNQECKLDDNRHASAAQPRAFGKGCTASHAEYRHNCSTRMVSQGITSRHIENLQLKPSKHTPTYLADCYKKHDHLDL
ncbi:hypothetical protein PF001_g8410 [Phytophthora fragariae]|uniref:Uncharacterized protein n=1 Tax=Phytophthora fragariae TaxID=53985 RepID=A0A6A4DXC1_9STRA|nr:hypothetical protein PF001_g8410 [Phytophthora fragariae]